MKDHDLRQAVKKRLLRSICHVPNAFLLEEFGVHHGSARIDLVIVNGLLHGFELKSDSDTLDRLPDQIRLYSSVFDRVTLVVGYRHAYAALKMVPEWWGVKLAHVGQRGAIRIADARSARRNPNQDPLSLASLLWRGEALQLLSQVYTVDGHRSKRRSVIYRRLSEITDADTIRAFVMECLRLRTCQQVDRQRM